MVFGVSESVLSLVCGMYFPALNNCGFGLILGDGCLHAATLAHVTDLGFLWFREFYLETSRVIQVCSGGLFVVY